MVRVATAFPFALALIESSLNYPDSQAVTRTGFQVLVGQEVTLDLQLQPATLQESVTVTAEAPLVDVTRSRASGNIDPRQMQELPVQGRNWMNLTMLAPGSRVNAVREIPITSEASSVGVQMNLDGQQVTNMVALGFGQPRYSRDAIAEFEFTGRVDASQGRSMGVQVNAITKSGTNRYEGSFSGYFRNDRFNAEDPVTGQGTAIFEPADQHDIWRTYSERPVPLLCELRVRARAADVRLQHPVSEVQRRV